MGTNQSSGNVASYTIEYLKEDGSRVKDVLSLPQAEYEKLISLYPTIYHAEKKYEPFSMEKAHELINIGEKLAVKGHVKTDSFEKTVAFLMSLTEAIWKTVQEHESFRIEFFYNAETLNTNYCLFVPTDRSALESSHEEKGEMKC